MAGYWLSLIEKKPGHALLEVELGQKPCRKPGAYRVWVGNNGPVCPGCDRTCRIPASADLWRGDAILVRKESR